MKINCFININIKIRSVKFLVSFGLVAALLSGCSSEPTLAPVGVVTTEAPTAIPTFTDAPITPATATPTLIVVPPTDTPTPVVAPTPTITPRPTPTLTPTPTPTTRPTATPKPTLSPDEIRQRYKIPLPGYLPAGFQLERLNLQEIGTTNVVTLLAEYSSSAPPGARFIYSVQMVILPTPTPTLPTTPITGTLAAVLTSGSITTTVAIPRPTLPVAATGSAANGLKIEEVTVRNVKALLSYRTDFVQSTLAWAETDKTFSLNGALSKEEILKVAAGLQ